jgi:uncharacterized protein (TIGR02466 family)
MKTTIIFTNFFTVCEINDTNNQEIIDYILQLKKNNKSQMYSNVGGWQNNIVNLNNLHIKKLVETTLEKTNSLKDELGFKKEKKVILNNMWVNVNEKNNFNLSHYHPISFFSAVYYVKFPKNSGKIVFENVNPLHAWFINNNSVEHFNHFTSNDWKLTPKEGDLVIFPSWLKHYVEVNESDETRISISFNTHLI